MLWHILDIMSIKTQSCVGRIYLKTTRDALIKRHNVRLFLQLLIYTSNSMYSRTLSNYFQPPPVNPRTNAEDTYYSVIWICKWRWILCWHLHSSYFPSFTSISRTLHLNFCDLCIYALNAVIMMYVYTGYRWYWSSFSDLIKSICLITCSN